jgi:hypothetical protein
MTQKKGLPGAFEVACRQRTQAIRLMYVRRSGQPEAKMIFAYMGKRSYHELTRSRALPLLSLVIGSGSDSLRVVDNINGQDRVLRCIQTVTSGEDFTHLVETRTKIQKRTIR